MITEVLRHFMTEPPITADSFIVPGCVLCSYIDPNRLKVFILAAWQYVDLYPVQIGLLLQNTTWLLHRVVGKL